MGKYRRSASNRKEKIVRAIKSCLEQSFRDFELIVVADGCDTTVSIVKANFFNKDDRLRLIKIHKAKMWSGIPRNAGIQSAKGKWIVYLDIDDIFLKDHLKIIKQGMEEKPGYDWYWFNDLSYNLKRGGLPVNAEGFDEHGVDIEVKGRCGTSNVCHRRDLNAYWSFESSYLHDWIFINRLKAKSKNYVKIPTPQYGICHVPTLLDV